MNPTLATARHLNQLGISTIPILPAGPRGDKRPAIAWKQWQTALPTTEHIDEWFTRHQGIAALTGTGTDGHTLAMVELEGRAADRLQDVIDEAENRGLDTLLTTMIRGWSEHTPSGGIHIYALVRNNTHGNRKLAKDEEGLVLAETRENGGYSICAPTPGTHHHTGNPWTLASDGANPARITAEQWEAVLDCFRILNHTTTPTPTPTSASKPAHAPAPASDSVTPGDDFEERHTWADILTPHGWVPVSRHGDQTEWRRPGKTTGVSATTGHADDRDRLYVFSTSTCFPADEPITKFHAYAILNHAGDHSAAATALAARGYGTRHEPGHAPEDEWARAKYAQGKTTAKPQPQQAEPEPAKPAPAAVSAASYSATFPHTEFALADHIRTHAAGRLRHIPETATWAWWNGTRWETDRDGHARRTARAAIETLPENTKEDIAFKKRSHSKRAIDNALAIMAFHPRIATPLAAFDRDPHTLATPEGAVDLRTGRLAPPDKNTLNLRHTAITPKLGPHPRWDAFLDQTFTSDPQLTHFAQRLAGLFLIGQVTEQYLFFAHGQGANGKSVMFDLYLRILGTGPDGYAFAADPELLTAPQGRHPADLAALHGIRLAVASELEEGRRFNEARIKLLTGGDTISARHMYGNFFNFTPSHTLVVLANHEPETRAGGPAFWRRIAKIPFLNNVPAHLQDPDLPDKLWNEAPQILAWMIQGAVAYLAEGRLHLPDAVRDATADYEKRQDTFADFLADRCILGDPNQLTRKASDIRAAYDSWCRENGASPLGRNEFWNRLASKGVKRRRSHGTVVYDGIALAPTAADDANDWATRAAGGN